MRDEVELQDMVVYFIGVLIKATEGIYLVVSAIGDRGIDQASGPLAESTGDLRAISVHHGAILHRGIRHNEGIVG